MSLSRRGDRLHVEEVFEPPPAALRDAIRRHKHELLDLLDYVAEADELLLEATHALAVEWGTPGCTLDATWDRLEDAVNEAYWTLDLDRLRAALAERDRHALALFAAHRERTT